jgi:hypothetical protein
MKKVLYVNPIYIFGHVNFDKIHIKALEDAGCDVKLVMHRGIAQHLPYDEGKYALKIPPFFIPGPNASSFGIRVLLTLMMLYIKVRVNVKSYDLVVFSTFEEMTTWLVPLCRHKFLISHGNVGEMRRPLKRFFTKRIAKSNAFIVFNDHMQQRLKSFGVKHSFVVSHGCVPPYTKEESAAPLPVDTSGYEMVVFHPSASPDAGFLDMVTNNSRLHEFLEREKILLILRDKHGKHASGHNIAVITRFLETGEYRSLFLAADAVLIAYPEDFCYKVSGVSYECVANTKKMLVRHIPAMEYCKDLCNYNPFFTDAESLIERLAFLKNHPEAACTASPAALKPDYTEVLQYNWK